MDYERARTYLLLKPEAVEDFPFGPDVAVMKVQNKMFATLSYHNGLATMNLKCEPNEALLLRDMHSAVLPGYHMNKRHWNTLLLDDSIAASEIERMIDASFALVVKGLKRAERTALEIRHGKDALYRGQIHV
ncbi:MAG: MmcQ/YjbR family DNA-binding protein [Gammaproteobacteria bacterium]|nr:MmcQ/YjbR family DNA-binding protein [Gammaproteobacteria bacterium]